MIMVVNFLLFLYLQSHYHRICWITAQNIAAVSCKVIPYYMQR